ncbi:MAG: DEAD/DEAH box helicase, partial [Bacteroidota bacterium]
QIKGLKKGVQIVVATPGRLIDLIGRRAINLKGVKSVILDEADEMLNMGFLDSINEILEEVPPQRNMLMFSATIPAPLGKIAKTYMKDPIEITIGNKNTGAENIKHLYYTVHAKDKYTALKRIVDFYPAIYGIVFCRTRIDTQEIADKLIADGYNAEALHGDLSQAQRDSVMQKFRIRHLQLLVATDVAARGIDVDDLTHIINYNLPDDPQTYTHRSGRTGRAGKSGISISIINLREKYMIRNIEKLINKEFKAVKVPGGREICEKQLFNMITKMEMVEIDHTQIDTYLPVIYKKLEWIEKEDVIKRFVALEFNRFLEYYRNAKDINATEDHQGDRGDRGDRKGRWQGRDQGRDQGRNQGRGRQSQSGWGDKKEWGQGRGREDQKPFWDKKDWGKGKGKDDVKPSPVKKEWGKPKGKGADQPKPAWENKEWVTSFIKGKEEPKPEWTKKKKSKKKER